MQTDKNEFIDGKNRLKEKHLEKILKINYEGTMERHWHADNFCLRWERLNDDSDKIDWTKPPQVYLIDFDYAQFKV